MIRCLSFSLRTLLLILFLFALFFATVVLPLKQVKDSVELLEDNGVRVVRVDESRLATIFSHMRHYHVYINDCNSEFLEERLSVLPHVDFAYLLEPNERLGSIVSAVPDLTAIEISDASGSVAKRLLSAQKLQAIKISGRRFFGAELDQLSSLENLQILDVSNSSISDSSLDKIVEITSLRELNLSHTDISDQGIGKLSAIHIKSLYLNGTRITKVGVAEIANFDGVVMLGIRCQEVSDEDLMCFADGKIQDSLSWLYIDAIHFDSNGESSLKLALPDCTIHAKFKVAAPIYNVIFDLSDDVDWSSIIMELNKSKGTPANEADQGPDRRNSLVQ